MNFLYSTYPIRSKCFTIHTTYNRQIHDIIIETVHMQFIVRSHKG